MWTHLYRVSRHWSCQFETGDETPLRTSIGDKTSLFLSFFHLNFFISSPVLPKLGFSTPVGGNLWRTVQYLGKLNRSSSTTSSDQCWAVIKNRNKPLTGIKLILRVHNQKIFLPRVLSKHLWCELTMGEHMLHARTMFS